QIVEELIDIEPSRRAKNAGHVAKSLRVFLKSEEEPKEARLEEQVVMPEPAAVAALAALAREEPEEDEEPEEEQKPRPPRHGKPAAVEEAVDPMTRIREAWAEFRPHPRDLVYIAAGAVGMVLLLLLIEFITNIRFMNVACLVTGAAVTFFVERIIRWREHRA